MMRSIRNTVLGSAVAFLLLVFLQQPAGAQDDVMRAMKDELERSVKQLQLPQMDKPYFVAYRMDDVNETTISASLGSLTLNQPGRTRLIGVEVRVGDYALDNSNYFSAATFAGGMAGMFSSISQAPLDDNYQQIRRRFWLATDAQYKKGLENLSAKRAALKMRKGEELPDFSKTSPAQIRDVPSEQGTPGNIEELARTLSAAFRSTPDIYASSVDVVSRQMETRYVNSEGSSFVRSLPVFKLVIAAETQASDGLPISDSIQLFGRTRADLPPTEALLAQVKQMADRILKLRSATLVDRYNGPVLFEGPAAAEVFVQDFATGLMAVRTPMSDDSRFEMFFNQMMSQLGGSSFVDKLGGRVLPDFLSVTDDPLQAEVGGTKLMGTSKVDDDGVKTQTTLLVDHGVLKTLLTTRTPVRVLRQSTGSRRGWGPAPSNLLVTSAKSLSSEELHKELLRRVKERGLDYGIVVRRVGGGSAASFMKAAARMAAQTAGSSSSLAEIYKVYPDGHEELVRGVEIAEMTPAAFKDVVAVGANPVVYSDEFIPRIGALFSLGVSATSDVPIVSCVVPAMLFDDISIVKSQGPFPNPPISPSPLAKQ